MSIPQKTHLFKEKKLFFNHVPQFEFSPVAEQYFGVFKTLVPPSTISHMSSFPQAMGQFQRKTFERRILQKSVDSQVKIHYHNTFCASVLLPAFDR